MHDDLREAGASLVAISPQKRQYSAKMKEDHGLEFPVLSDEGNRVAAKFNLVYEFPDDLKKAHEELGAPLPRFNGDDSWTLPMAARYVIRRDGTIAHADVSADYKVRPEPKKTLKQVRALQGDLR